MDNNYLDTTTFKVIRIRNGTVINSFQYEQDMNTYEIISKTPVAPNKVSVDHHDIDLKKLHLSFINFEQNDKGPFQSDVSIKLEKTIIPASPSAPDCNNATAKRPFNNNHNFLKVDSNAMLNIITMIRCQNCETNFPTKYQYQRHQCEFNAEKVVLKPDADIKDIDKGMRIKYDCSTCGKQFVSKNNLDRHQACHENTQSNICEHCNKQFVSENRLRIHKENHCKKAGDISKFYRSDVAVWKCKKCHEVFSSVGMANLHSDKCKELVFVYDEKTDEHNSSLEFLKQEIKSAASLVNDESLGKSSMLENQNVEKILTEILLQCEFCNRTYADKKVLLLHQKTHTTEKNYECVNCSECFSSYIAAVQHWLKMCNKNANLFYLPKLLYCEYCDRTFKSHELLYTHKGKKKHYTYKTHKDIEVSKCSESNSFKDKSNNAINKLIEDVLITLDRPITKQLILKENNHENGITEISSVKLEDWGGQQSDSQQESISGEEPEKKRRGRKRKWPKVSFKEKRLAVDREGFKYQCERCGEVWDGVLDLEFHRQKQHAATYNCDECGQVLHSAKALLIHSRAHKSLKPYVCDTCGKSYSQTSHLWQHMRFHQVLPPQGIRIL